MKRKLLVLALGVVLLLACAAVTSQADKALGIHFPNNFVAFLHVCMWMFIGGVIKSFVGWASRTF